MMSVAGEWLSFQGAMLKKGLPDDQQRTARQCFYAGVISGLSILDSARHSKTNADFLFLVRRLQGECISWAKEDAEEQLAAIRGEKNGSADGGGDADQGEADTAGREAGADDVPPQPGSDSLVAFPAKRQPDGEGPAG